MLAKKLLGLIFIGALAAGSGYAAEIIVKERPPKAISERRGRAPGKDYVWIPGYHRWEGNHYAWEKGRWDRPPHDHARWIAPRWDHRKEGYVFIEGHWGQGELFTTRTLVPAASSSRRSSALPMMAGFFDRYGIVLRGSNER